MAGVNPFRYGALALDEAFTDRQSEISELKADVRNGQDVVIFAPRRYGKSSLVWRASQELAVMCDTFRPLKLTPLSRDLDDPSYALSWYEEDAEMSPTTIP